MSPMSDYLDDQESRSRARAPRLYYGKYAGLVTNNEPPEDGSHRGQVKVKVPGILEEAPGGSSQPIEVLAAPAFLPGFFFVPEVGAQVWVEFVAGDINHPIWTGVWYPKDAPPADSDGSAPDEHKKIIRVPLGQGAEGHVIHLDHTSGSEKLVLKDEKNKNTITMDKNGVKIECQQQSGTSTITMDKDGVKIEFGKSSLTLTDSKIILKSPDVVAKVDNALEVE